MQALSFVNRVEPTSTTKKKKVTKVIPRKPNENQKNTKYSKSNLAYILKNKLDVEKNKRFMKDLHRYYKNIDELKRDME